ncbi:hypothetical protein [Pandoraea sputorum]|uniref:Uncharacterized protein n=1 Tax=Pandoraea sputorum TaxID=93222 RepID=A0A239S8L9_9BURK|nr:hypothetical protein [Pandoraea sputorum]AJC15925.1 hypothetical protein NA29_07315 [Pandoraea sputorum]SNU81740.1 Uncharacterised protein [Pandoraea sputorum]VVD63813.1 hypothetical protein PSP20601_00236 [Pandoraea sputorum]
MLTLTSIQDVESKPSSDIDVLIVACGYEGRARAAAQEFHTTAKSKLAIGFSSQRELEYEANKAWFESAGFDLVEVGDNEFRAALEQYLLPRAQGDGVRKVEVDISCFNRFRLAHLVDVLRTLSASEVTVIFRYSIAKFTPPVEDTAPTVSVEPVIPQFAGWTTRPDRPPAAIVGLGYEPNKAIGIVDHLEINNATWAYYPLGPIPEYYQRVLEGNRSLLNIIQADGRCQPYDLDEPAQLFHEINSLVDMLKPHFNTVLIPFGPKLFALVTLLVASLNDDVGVWRVSSGSLEEPVNREPSGHIVSVSATFRDAP